jgi:heterodisulfide reductase subunit A
VSTVNPPNEKPANGNQQPKVGVYVCRCGGNISDVVSVEKVADAAGQMPDVVVARQNTFMCSHPGQQMIVDDIAKLGLNRVVVAACSPRLHELTFRKTLVRGGLNPYLFEHANIREQVSWVSKSDPEGATDKATRLVGAAVAKVRLSRPLDPIKVDATRQVLIIGGGVSGLRCARDLSLSGFRVVLVERSPALGGRLTELGRLYPVQIEAREVLHSLISEVSQDAGIQVVTSAEVTAVSGSIGNFSVAVRRAQEETAINVGAIVLATGFDTYEPLPGEYGYAEYSEVITLPQFIRLLEKQDPADGQLERNGRPVKNICLIHCVGSRQIEGIHQPGPDGRLHDYCSRFCCTAALQAANEIRQRFPTVNVFDAYRDIRTYGRGHESYYEQASKQGVIFFRFLAEQLPQIRRADANGSALVVQVKDTLTWGEDVEVPADLVVLVTGAVPRDLSRLINMLKLSRSPDGFLQEVHPKLRPVETAVSGVFLAGGCQAPMDVGESCTAASAAAARVSAALLKGYVELEPFVAVADPELCTGTGACIEVCRHQQAISLVDLTVDGVTMRRAQVNPALCGGCGMCVPACPHGAIQVDGWRLEQFEAMVDAIAADY